MKRYAPVICLLFLFFDGETQNIIPRFETINVNEGLSQSYICSIYQDRKGYMWFGTADGVNRYDGQEIKGYKQSNPSAAANSNFVRGRLCEDRQGNIWYANETGIYCYSRVQDAITLKYDLSKTRFKGFGFESVYIDDAHTLWLVNNGSGVFSFHTVSADTAFYACQPENGVFASPFNTIAAQGNQYLWFSRNKAEGLFRFNTATKVTTRHFQGKVYSCIAFANQKMYLASKYTIDIYDETFHRIDSILLPPFRKTEGYIRNIMPDHYGRIWIGTVEDGLFVYDSQTSKLTQFRRESGHQQSISSDLITLLHIDRGDNLWIGTDGGGVCRLDLKPSRFQLFPFSEAGYPFLNDHFIKCLYEDEQGKIWFGTSKEGLAVYDPLTGSLKNHKSHPIVPGALPGNVGAIFKDKERRIWIGYTTGIALFDPEKEQSYPIPLLGMPSYDRPRDNFAYQITQLSSGQLLAATKFGILTISKNAQGAYTGVFPKKQFATVLATDVDELEPGNIWYCAPVNGLYHVQIKDSAFQLRQRFLQNMDLRCIHKDEEEKDILWVGAGIGLIRFDTRTGQYIVFDGRQGLANSYVYGVLEDEYHNLWLSTNGGISQFNKKERTFINYNYKDGLQSNEFNTGAYHKGASGALYFGGIKGFNWFMPGKMALRVYEPGVAISQIAINDVVYPPDATFAQSRSMILPYDQNDLSFRLSVLDYTLPLANKVQYQLEGWDKKWTTSYNKNVRYSNLPPGRYTLHVRAINSSGLYSPEEKILLTITPPFWHTWWFYLFTAIVVTGTVVWVTRKFAQRKLKAQVVELERQQMLEKERQRISREMHDDIGAGLTQIALMSQVASQYKKAGLDHQQELDDISRSCRQLIGNMSEIIWSLSPDNRTLEQLISYLREQLNKLLEYAGMEANLQLPENGSEILLSHEQRRNIVLITREIVHNAIKHSKAKKMCIKAELCNSTLVVMIKDDGVGFDTEKGYQGNGLRNVRQRVKELGGRLEVESQPGKGTCFTYTVTVGTT